MLEFVNFYLIPGVVVGAIYTLGAIGISLIFAILRMAHLAHGDLMAMGAYIALAFVAGFGLPVWAALPLAMLATAGVAALADRTCYRPLRSQRPVMMIIASFGVALMLRAAIQFFWGPQSHTYGIGIQPPVLIGGLRIAERHILIILIAVALVLALQVFLSRTVMGKAMRAVSDNPELARACGINSERVILWMWIVAGALCAAAGVMLGLDTQLTPLMGFSMLLPMFAAALLGGIGRPFGAIAGGLIIGIAEEMATYPFFGAALLEPTYKPVVAFVILVAILLWRPTGLFRGRVL